MRSVLNARTAFTVGKVIAMALAKTPEQHERIREQSVEVRSTELANDRSARFRRS
jgi:hypothetical protein